MRVSLVSTGTLFTRGLIVTRLSRSGLFLAVYNYGAIRRYGLIISRLIITARFASADLPLPGLITSGLIITA